VSKHFANLEAYNIFIRQDEFIPSIIKVLIRFLEHTVNEGMAFKVEM
jgi:hypothetical protein